MSKPNSIYLFILGVGIKFLTIVLFVSATTVLAAVHTITSLPYTANQTGTAYSETLTIAGTKLSSTTNGLNITGHDIVLNLGTDTLEFGTGCGDDLYGIKLPYGSYNIKVEGGTILHNPSCSGDSAWSCTDVDLGSAHDVLFHNTNMIVEGWNGHCMVVWDGSPKMIEINGGHFTSNVRGYTDRCAYDGCAIRVGTTAAITGSEYSYKIHGIHITTSPHVGIKAAGKCLIYDDTINIDARNDLYTTYTNFCYTSVNPYGIAMRCNYAGTKVYNNVITSGTTYEGGEGILVEGCEGATDNNIDIYGNTINVHNGPNLYTQGSGGQTMGLFLRGLGNSYVHFYDNNITITLDTLSSTKWYGKVSEGLRTDYYLESYGCGSGAPHDNIIENNRVTIVANTGGTESSGRTIAQKDDAGIYNNIDRYNRYKAGKEIVVLNTTNASCSNMLLYKDTLEFVGNEPNRMTWHIGRDNTSSINNIARDCVYLNGTSDTNIVWVSSSGENELALQRTLSVNVRGSDNQPIAGASVKVVNHYNSTVLSTTTNSQGVATGIVSYWYEAEDGSDSLGFNTFSSIATKGTQSDTSIFTINSSNAMVTNIIENGGSNNCPSVPVLSLPVNGDTVLGLRPNLVLNNSTDADLDSLTYDFQVYSDIQMTDLAASGTNITQGINITYWQVGADLPDESWYWWKARSYDGACYSDWSETSSFYVKKWVSGVDDSQPTLKSPADGATLRNSRPTLEVYNITGFDSLVYYFQLGSDTQFTNPVQSGGVAEGSVITSWMVANSLSKGNYCWRARVFDGSNFSRWSEAGTFTVASEVYAYPTPFKPSSGDEHITFTNIPLGSNIKILTLDGELVKKFIDIQENQIIWDVKNEKGDGLASGVYLYIVDFKSGNTKGKIVVIK